MLMSHHGKHEILCQGGLSAQVPAENPSIRDLCPVQRRVALGASKGKGLVSPFVSHLARAIYWVDKDDFIMILITSINNDRLE